MALTLDFGGVTTTAAQVTVRRHGPFRLRVVPASGPRRYAALEHRRRQAQIRARRLLDLVDR
jgi:hypothetical protein